MINIGRLLESLLQLKYIMRVHDSKKDIPFNAKNETFIEIDLKKCTLCGECADVCAADSILIDEKSVEIKESCILCGICAIVCPNEAMILTKKSNTENKK